MKTWIYRLCVIGILALFSVLSIGSALRESLTFDEIVYLQEGKANLVAHTFSIDPYNPPLIRELTAISEVLGFPPLYSRFVVVILGFLLVYKVMSMTRGYFGQVPSLIAGLFMALEPTFLANSHYITPDVGLTLFILLTYNAFLNLLLTQRLENYFYFGLFLGLSMASKISAIPFLLLSFIVVFIVKRKSFGLDWHVEHAGDMVFSFIVALFVVWSTYFFRMTPILVKHDNPERLSNKILQYADTQQLAVITSGITVLQNQPVPLGDYLGILKNNVLRAKTSPPAFFWKEIRSRSAWYMMPIHFLLKLPTPYFILLFVAIFGLKIEQVFYKFFPKKIETAKNTNKSASEKYSELPKYKIATLYNQHEEVIDLSFFIIPFVVIIACTAFLGMTPLVRYILPAIPFLVIVISSSWFIFRDPKRKILLGVLVLWVVVTAFLNFPHYISYANEFIPQQKKFEYFTDSNLDWGQGLMSFSEYIRDKKPATLLFSYFGRDNADLYGFSSDKVWGSYKNDEICAFHTIEYPEYRGPSLTAISVSNWYGCEYYLQPTFQKQRILDIVADSILIFSSQ